MSSRPAAKSARKKQPLTEKQLALQQKNRRYHSQNGDRSRRRMRQAYHSLSPAEKLLLVWRRQAKPPRPQQGSVRSRTPRVVALAQAYCDWSDTEEVVRMYTAAAVMTELTGVEYVVDHVVPLSNPFVCGLHTHTNMQVITRAENALKSNWLWPGMSPLTWDSMAFLAQCDMFENNKSPLQGAECHGKPQHPGPAAPP